jgi:hypothetical protein
VPVADGTAAKITQSRKKTFGDRKTSSAHEICRSGGVVNLESALNYAQERYPGQMAEYKR